MTTVICSSCGRPAVVLDKGQGGPLLCNHCNQPFCLPGSPTQPAGADHPGISAWAASPSPAELPALAAQYKSCPYCAEQVLAAAKKCKHCGEAIDGAPPPAAGARRATGTQQAPSRNWREEPQVIVVVPQKDVGTAILLAVLFGPLGMLYATVPGAIIMFVLTIVLSLLTCGLSIAITWPICVIWAATAAKNPEAGLVAWRRGAPAESTARDVPTVLPVKASRPARGVQRAVRRGEPKRPKQPLSKWMLYTYLGAGLFGFLALIGLVLLVVAVITWQQRAAVNEGTRLWDAGQRHAAIEKYKRGYPSAGKQKLAVLRRIVEGEMAGGDQQVAREWVQRGMVDGLNVKSFPLGEKLTVQMRGENAGARGEQRGPQRRTQERRTADHTRSGPDQTNGQTITAIQLRQEFLTSPKTANSTYKGKLLRVSGTVAEVFSPDELSDSVRVWFQPESADCTVICWFSGQQRREASGVRPGQQITVRGRCDGKFLSGELRLSSCSLE
jgi:hypothetical protein